jgi:hypothetical protein
LASGEEGPVESFEEYQRRPAEMMRGKRRGRKAAREKAVRVMR